jgi:hypothetical protein
MRLGKGRKLNKSSYAGANSRAPMLLARHLSFHNLRPDNAKITPFSRTSTLVERDWQIFAYKGAILSIPPGQFSHLEQADPSSSLWSEVGKTLKLLSK